MTLQKCIRILSIRSFVHEQALADKYHENSIQGAYGGGNQGYEVERRWSMVHMGHGWVHNMEGSHQEHNFQYSNGGHMWATSTKCMGKFWFQK